jgi:hypothetical protein
VPYGSEIARGFDVWRLTPTPELSVVRSLLDQLVRADAIPANICNNVDKELDKAEGLHEEGENAAARAQLQSAIKHLRGLVLVLRRGRGAPRALSWAEARRSF